jgi:hypothetical protein
MCLTSSRTRTFLSRLSDEAAELAHFLVMAVRVRERPVLLRLYGAVRLLEEGLDHEAKIGRDPVVAARAAGNRREFRTTVHEPRVSLVVAVQRRRGAVLEVLLQELARRVEVGEDVAYQLPILERFGLNCYGCCEPLNPRWDIVKAIPRLRRVSCSPWADYRKMAELLGKDYVFSMKPKPTPLASASFDREECRRELRENLRITLR